LKKNNLVIIGAGLVGSLFSIYLRRRGYEVALFERRDDLRKLKGEEGRSINLIITEKGIQAVKELDLWKDVKKLTVPVSGRMMHDREGKTHYQSYSADDSELNYSISRKGLNELLLNQAEKEGVKIFFNRSLDKVDFENRVAFFNNEEQVEFKQIFGADGSNSRVRKELMSFLDKKDIQFKDNLEDLGVSYKELYLPADESGKYKIEKNALHIWPRGKYFLMALPNVDGSFTMTLYLQNEGDPCFKNIKTKDDVKELFEKDFKDSIALMPEYLDDFFRNTTGNLATVRCFPWVYKDVALLLGDAAHGIVPFFGQGMNSGFSDCFILGNLIDHHNDWDHIFQEFYLAQKKNGDAIADMAIENYMEMSDKTADPKFLLKKEAERILGSEFSKNYISRYSMVVHSLTPYHVAKEVGKVQESILNELVMGIDTIKELDLKKASELIESKLVPLYKEKGINS